MVRRHVVWMALIAALLHARPSAAPPTRDVPVTSIVWGAGPADAAHTIQSDGSGPYVHAVQGSSGVESHIQSGGGWELDLYYYTTSRRLAFNLPAPIPGSSGGAAPTGFIVAPGRLITKCPVAGENLLAMDPAVPIHSCALDGRFDYNGQTYLVRFDEARFPGTRHPRVSCTGVNPGNTAECVRWHIDSCGPGETGACTPAVMSLAQEVRTSKGKVSVVRVADYAMQFEIDVLRP